MKEILLVVICLAVGTFPSYGCAGAPAFDVAINTNGSYSLLVNGMAWLNSGDTEFKGNGVTFSTYNGSLELIDSKTGRGSDKFGPWSDTSFLYQAGTFKVQTTIKVYTDTNISAAVFTQTYMDDVTNTSVDSADNVISKFPSFRLQSPNPNLGYLAYAGNMVGYSSLSMGRLLPYTHFPTGLKGGPLVLFDNSSNVIIISPLSQFMASSSSIDFLRQINWGIMGFVNSVPSGYSIDFIVYYSNQGINQAMKDWGLYMTTLYQKSTDRRDRDPTIMYLGYWTDNGAYYYYNTESNKNYEDTILDTVDYINTLGVPFKYLQFDSWWYLKGEHQGTKTWEPRNDVFPSGFRNLSEKTKLPFGCHNRFWDGDTTYARYNGGPYNFIQDSASGLSVPYDAKFWQDLLRETQSWGQFILYEQDWLDRETTENVILQNNLYMGQTWLQQMGQAAEEIGTVTIQYCMSYSRHILQTLEIPVVTQARVSQDYQPGNHQWNIGITSLFADAINIAPFKDTFWTSSSQPGDPYKKTEPNVRLQVLIATLSTGPVGPGDGIGFLNKTLLMKCCDASGLILKPSKPVTAIDDQIRMAAFKSPYPGPDGNVYTTYSVISEMFFGIAVANEMNNDYSLTPASAWPTVQFPASLAFPADNPHMLQNFSNSQPIAFGKGCTIRDFCLFYTSPIIRLESGRTFAILGELNKWVPVSPQRVKDIRQSQSDIFVQITVQAQEVVAFSIYVEVTNEVKTVVCDNSKSSLPPIETVISVATETCTIINA